MLNTPKDFQTLMGSEFEKFKDLVTRLRSKLNEDSVWLQPDTFLRLQMPVLSATRLRHGASNAWIRIGFKMKKLITTTLAAILAVTALAGVASAQTQWPTKPLRIIVPWPPGGSADTSVRHLQAPLQEILGQPVVIENKSGGGGMIGVEALTRSAADGYAIALTTSALTAAPAIYSSLAFDAAKDVKPVTIFVTSPNVISVHPSAPYKSLKELLDAAKAQPGKVIIATSGNGTAQHFGFEQIKIATGTDMVHLPYRGAGPALNDLVAGQIPIGYLNIAGTLPHVQSGRLRAIAVTGLKRSDQMPDVPTIAETIPDFDFTEWHALIAPSAVPDDIVEKLYVAIAKAARTQQYTDKVKGVGMVVDILSPADSTKKFAGEFKRLADLAKAAKIKAD